MWQIVWMSPAVDATCPGQQQINTCVVDEVLLALTIKREVRDTLASFTKL